MARRSRESLLDGEVVQEFHADRLSDAPSDCESDTSSNDDEDDFGPSTSQKGRKWETLEVSESDVNIDDGWIKNDDYRNLEQFLGNIASNLHPMFVPVFLKQ
jgi:hypothetical protein